MRHSLVVLATGVLAAQTHMHVAKVTVRFDPPAILWSTEEVDADDEVVEPQQHWEIWPARSLMRHGETERSFLRSDPKEGPRVVQGVIQMGLQCAGVLFEALPSPPSYICTEVTLIPRTGETQIKTEGRQVVVSFEGVVTSRELWLPGVVPEPAVAVVGTLSPSLMQSWYGSAAGAVQYAAASTLWWRGGQGELVRPVQRADCAEDC